MTDNSRLEAEVCYNHGNFLASQEKLEEALSAYELAITLDGHVPMYYNNRAAILKRLGRVEEAVKQYRRIISDFPDYGKAHLSIASTEIELKNYIASECSYKNFIAAYMAGHFEFISRWGGIDRSQALYGKDKLEIIFLSSISYLKKSLIIQAIKSFNESLNLAKFYSLISSDYSSIQIDRSLEAIAINNAVIAVDYENNPEVNSLEVKLLKEKWISGSMIEGCSCNNWYLEINKNRGDAASYSLDMVIHTDSNHDYPFVIITCGLKLSGRQVAYNADRIGLIALKPC